MHFYVNGVLDYFYEFPVNQFGVRPTKVTYLPLTIGKILGRVGSYWFCRKGCKSGFVLGRYDR
jgi:7-keto-8-aminopelargonate synthetase-like enzyme